MADGTGRYDGADRCDETEQHDGTDRCDEAVKNHVTGAGDEAGSSDKIDDSVIADNSNDEASFDPSRLGTKQ